MKYDVQHLLLVFGGAAVSAFVTAFVNSGSVLSGKALASAGVTAVIAGLAVLKQAVDAGKALTSQEQK